MNKRFADIFKLLGCGDHSESGKKVDDRDQNMGNDIRTASGIVRKKIIFQGNVQFVGFRFQSKTIADALGLTGFVENLSDGDVLMEVQGSEHAIEDLIDALRVRRPIRIDSMDVSYLPIDEEEKGFRYVW